MSAPKPGPSNVEADFGLGVNGAGAGWSALPSIPRGFSGGQPAIAKKPRDLRPSDKFCPDCIGVILIPQKEKNLSRGRRYRALGWEDPSALRPSG